VDILGLRTIFPLLMKTPKKSKRKGVSAEEHEEHTISVVVSVTSYTKWNEARLFD
jgi:beta-catenin-like protein 1